MQGRGPGGGQSGGREEGASLRCCTLCGFPGREPRRAYRASCRRVHPRCRAGNGVRQESHAARGGAPRRAADLRYQRGQFAGYVRAADLRRQRARHRAVEGQDQGRDRACHGLRSTRRGVLCRSGGNAGAGSRRRAFEIQRPGVDQVGPARAHGSAHRRLRRARHGQFRELQDPRGTRRQARRGSRGIARGGGFGLRAQ